MQDAHVAWLKHGRVEIDVVDDVLWFVPPALLCGKLSINMGRQDPVVKEVVMVLRWLVGDGDCGEPLDHSATNASWEKSSQRCSVVRSEPFTILLEREQHVTFTVQGPTNVNGSTILTCFTLWQLSQRSIKVDVSVFLACLCDPQCCKEVTQANTRPNTVANCCRSPVEANSLLAHVLLHAAIASTDESHREADYRAKLAFNQVLHTEAIGSSHSKVLELDFMRLPVKSWNCSMVPHNMQGWWGDPAAFLQLVEGRLRVEGVSSSEAKHVLVSLDPLIWSANIPCVYLGSVLPWWHH
mmetsp:Transcript_52754/g.97641  ORF Transcript_52754/g.97641 Transcript_52754/m.97641 type:complete len:297 (+) Transcript_52754:1773-2663(+)